jgi:hypothetical protein
MAVREPALPLIAAVGTDLGWLSYRGPIAVFVCILYPFIIADGSWRATDWFSVAVFARPDLIYLLLGKELASPLVPSSSFRRRKQDGTRKWSQAKGL